MLTESQKQAIVEQYTANTDSANFNADLVLNIGRENDISPNLVRQILKEQNVYEDVKPVSKPSAKRPNKAASQQALIQAIRDKGVEMDEEEVKMITRMTGKSCVFFTKVLAT